MINPDEEFDEFDPNPQRITEKIISRVKYRLKKSKRPDRVKRFTEDDITNLKIALNTLDPVKL